MLYAEEMQVGNLINNALAGEVLRGNTLGGEISTINIIRVFHKD